MNNQLIYNQKKERLVKWHGWITILLVCLTPLVIIALPILMVNVSRIGNMLKESIISDDKTIEGKVVNLITETKYEKDIGTIYSEIIIETEDNSKVICQFKKYIGPKYDQDMKLNNNDLLTLKGTYQEERFLIKYIINQTNKQVYTSEPAISVY